MDESPDEQASREQQYHGEGNLPGDKDLTDTAAPRDRMATGDNG